MGLERTTDAGIAAAAKTGGTAEASAITAGTAGVTMRLVAKHSVLQFLIVVAPRAKTNVIVILEWAVKLVGCI